MAKMCISIKSKVSNILDKIEMSSTSLILYFYDIFVSVPKIDEIKRTQNQHAIGQKSGDNWDMQCK